MISTLLCHVRRCCSRVSASPVTLTLVSLCVIAIGAPPVAAICPPFPCPDCLIQSRGQLNLVVMDRAAGLVRVVPNLLITGTAEDFALVVPTPALPALAPTGRAIWDEASQLTATVWSSRSSDHLFDCDNRRFATPASLPTAADEGDVIIHDRQTIGGFEATIISADDPNALVDWLNVNGFEISTAEVELFAPYVTRGWFFTAMKLADPGQVPPNGWNANVDPVVFTFQADRFELPLPLLSINRATTFPVVVYVIDDHRAALPAFETMYANDITRNEYDAIVQQYPTLAAFLAPGRYLTRLDRTFTPRSVMDESIVVGRAPTNDEFRRMRVQGSVGIPLGLVLLGAPVLFARLRQRRYR